MAGGTRFSQDHATSGRGGARSSQRTTYSNKGCGQKAISQAIEKSAELALPWWLFGPENAIFYNRESPMPRKSANEIELATIAPAVPWTHERPDPPQGMPEAAATIW